MDLKSSWNRNVKLSEHFSHFCPLWCQNLMHPQTERVHSWLWSARYIFLFFWWTSVKLQACWFSSSSLILWRRATVSLFFSSWKNCNFWGDTHAQLMLTQTSTHTRKRQYKDESISKINRLCDFVKMSAVKTTNPTLSVCCLRGVNLKMFTLRSYLQKMLAF